MNIQLAFILIENQGKLSAGGAGVIKKEKKKREVIVTDPFGSYTGRPSDPQERPIQDADDL